MTYLILGGSGQVGSTFRNLLNQKKKDFLAPTREELNLTSFGKLVDFISEIRPKYILNFAGWTNVDAAENNERAALILNGHLPEALASAAFKYNSTLVHLSTDYVFSGIRHTPWRELEPTNPGNAYGRTKKHGEDAVLGVYPQNSYIFRTAWLYSKYGDNFAKTICRKILNSEGTLKVVDDQIGQPTLVNDLCEQIYAALEFKINPGIYHATNSGMCTWYEFAQEIINLIGNDRNRIQRISTSELKQLTYRPEFSVLGHESWEKVGIREMQNWKLALENSIQEIFQTVVGE